MADNKDVVPTESASPKTGNKRDKNKYQAFRSDDEDSSDADEVDSYLRNRPKSKKERSNASSFKVKIITRKGKKKEKDKEKEKKRKAKKVLPEEDTTGDNVEAPLHGPVFGVPLEKAVERSGFQDKVELPRVVRECIIYIEEKGLDSEGLYRVSGVKSKIDFLKQQYNEGRAVNLDDYDAYVVGGLLKLYLRELPSNILTSRLAPIFDSFINEEEEKQLTKYQQLMNDLPCPNKTLLGWLFTHFAHVLEKSSENKMNIQNLSICFSPTMSVSHGVLNLLFQFTNDLFPDVQLVKYTAPEEEEVETFPNTIDGLQAVLQDNEGILSKLHDRVKQEGGDNKRLMDDLWERQRKSTQLKRKIKELKKIEKLKKQEHLPENKTAEVTTPETQPANTNNDSIKSPTLRAENTTSTVKKSVATEETNAKEVLNNKPATLKDIARKSSVPQVDDETVKNLNAKVVKPPLKPRKEREREKDRNSWKAEVVTSRSSLVMEKKELEKESDSSQKQAEFNVNKKAASSGDLAGNIENKQIVKNQSVPDINGNVTNVVTSQDEDLMALFLEEQRLILENQELEVVGEMLRSKINSEKEQISILQDKLTQSSHHDSFNSSSSSLSSSQLSSRNSTESLHEDQNEDESEKDVLEMELQLKQLEEENKALEARSEELVQQIMKERQLCVQLKTDIRIREIKAAVM